MRRTSSFSDSSRFVAVSEERPSEDVRSNRPRSFSADFRSIVLISRSPTPARPGPSIRLWTRRRDIPSGRAAGFFRPARPRRVRRFRPTGRERQISGFHLHEVGWGFQSTSVTSRPTTAVGGREHPFHGNAQIGKISNSPRWPVHPCSVRVTPQPPLSGGWASSRHAHASDTTAMTIVSATKLSR